MIGGMTPFIFCGLGLSVRPRIKYWDVSGKRFDVRSRPAQPGWRVARGLGRWVDLWDLQRFTVVPVTPWNLTVVRDSGACQPVESTVVPHR